MNNIYASTYHHPVIIYIFWTQLEAVDALTWQIPISRLLLQLRKCLFLYTITMARTPLVA